MYDKIISELLKNNAVRATHFITNKEIIRVTRTRYGSKFSRGNLELTITKGKPNYAERELVKRGDSKVKMSGMTFFKYLPKKKVVPKKRI